MLFINLTNNKTLCFIDLTNCYYVASAYRRLSRHLSRRLSRCLVITSAVALAVTSAVALAIASTICIIHTIARGVQ